jgi:hypothetical protein
VDSDPRTPLLFLMFSLMFFLIGILFAMFIKHMF